MRLTKKQKLEQIEEIISLKGAERWRAVADFAIASNARVRKQHEAKLREIETIRAVQNNDNASSSLHKNFRHGASIPSGVWNALVGWDEMLDGTSLLKDAKKDHSNPMGTNEIVRTLARTFPEYKVYKNIEPTEEGYENN